MWVNAAEMILVCLNDWEGIFKEVSAQNTKKYEPLKNEGARGILQDFFLKTNSKVKVIIL